MQHRHSARPAAASIDPQVLQGLSLTDTQIGLLADRGVPGDVVVTLCQERLADLARHRQHLVPLSHLREQERLLLRLGPVGCDAGKALAAHLHEYRADGASWCQILPGLIAATDAATVMPGVTAMLADARRNSLVARPYAPYDRVGAALRSASWMDPDTAADIDVCGRQAVLSIGKPRPGQEGSWYARSEPSWSFRMGWREADRAVWQEAVRWVATPVGDEEAQGRTHIASAVEGLPFDPTRSALRHLRAGLADARVAPIIRRQRQLPDALVGILQAPERLARLQDDAIGVLAALGSRR